jgi:hypothetical protein
MPSTQEHTMTITDITTATDAPKPQRPAHLIVVADHTPGEHVTDSDDIWWWLPVLGPTATVLAYLLARHAAYDDTDWDTATLARSVGLGGSCSKLWTSLERLATFRVATFVGTDALTVRLYLPAA